MELATGPAPIWQSYGCAFAMFSASLVYSVVLAHFYQFAVHCGMNVRSELICALFQKVSLLECVS